MPYTNLQEYSQEEMCCIWFIELHAHLIILTELSQLVIWPLLLLLLLLLTLLLALAVAVAAAETVPVAASVGWQDLLACKPRWILRREK